MSNDMLGPLVRVLVTVPESRLGLVQDFAHKLAGSGGVEWAVQGKKFLRGELSVSEPKGISINRSVPFNPAEFFFDKGYTIKEEDERSLKLTEVDFARVQFVTMLEGGESSIMGEEKLARLKKSDYVRLDAKIFQTLWENQSLIPESWKEKVNGNIRHIFFDGTILRNPFDVRGVLCLRWRDGGWDWRCRWLYSGWDAYHPSAVLAS